MHYRSLQQHIKSDTNFSHYHIFLHAHLFFYESSKQASKQQESKFEHMQLKSTAIGSSSSRSYNTLCLIRWLNPLPDPFQITSGYAAIVAVQLSSPKTPLIAPSTDTRETTTSAAARIRASRLPRDCFLVIRSMSRRIVVLHSTNTTRTFRSGVQATKI
jgi:hypothetical protein